MTFPRNSRSVKEVQFFSLGADRLVRKAVPLVTYLIVSPFKHTSVFKDSI